MNAKKTLFSIAFFSAALTVSAQQNGDKIAEYESFGKYRVGGYGEAVAAFKDYGSNRFYGHPEGNAKENRNTISIPRLVIAGDYKFNSKWILGLEIEFESGGTGTAYELENTENGEYETEVEKGGEVELEQFWLQKTFSKALNLRIGHIVVPVGLNNAHHEPLSYFTVYRPEGENTIMPSTWHQTGLSLWGRYGDFRYEAQLLAGLNADGFTNVNWIKNGNKSPLEFDVANKYGVALRVDNYTVKGLRLGLSGYYGHSIGNSYPNNAAGVDAEYKGQVLIGAVDLTYKGYNWIVRGQADYGYLGDAAQLKYVYNRLNSKSPYKHSAFVSKNAYAWGIEAGYDLFSVIGNWSKVKGLNAERPQLYVFGRYEQYNPYASQTKGTAYDYTEVKRFAVGLNYHPIKQIVVKAEYSKRLLRSLYNDEPSVNVGVAYEGFFL